tara:strand:- start:1840 stop:2100 length:261 start_codon:yes stop_codon:yes gene_type:complete
MLAIHQPRKPKKLKPYVHFKRDAFSPFVTFTRRDGTTREIDFYEDDLEEFLLREGIPEADLVKIASYAVEFLDVYYKPKTGEVHAP